MNHTSHSLKRSNQRGISKELISLALYLAGNTTKDDTGLVILKRKEVVETIAVLNHIKKQLLRLVDKKGLVVVNKDNTILTAFNNN